MWWNCEIGECMIYIIDDRVVTYDGIEDIPKSTLMNPSDGINHCSSCSSFAVDYDSNIAEGHCC